MAVKPLWHSKSKPNYAYYPIVFDNEEFGYYEITVERPLKLKVNLSKENLDKPTLIKITTEIGYGSPKNQGKNSAHGAPLGAEDLKGTKKYFKLGAS